MLNYEQIKKKLDVAQTKKGSVDKTYREVFRFVMPDRDYYIADSKTDGSLEGQEVHSGVYSSVAINAGVAFVNKIQSALTPIKSDFIEVKTDNVNNRSETDAITKTINKYKNISNFDLECPSAYGDLIAGTCCLLAQKGTIDNPYQFTSIPIKDISYLEGANSMIVTVFRQFDITNTTLKHQWAELKDMKLEDSEADKEIKVIECVHYDYDKEIWNYYVVNEDKKEIVVSREYKYNPFIILRWDRISGEIYGRGVGMQALPDIRTHNDMKGDQLKVSHFSLPIFLAEEDSMTDPDEFILEPLAMNPVQSNNTGSPSITQLPVATQTDILNFNLEMIEASIKRTMLDNILPEQVRPGVSATEIIERVQANDLNVSSVFGRLDTEWLIPLTKAMMFIAQDFGLITQDIDINRMASQGISIEFNTPLMKQQERLMVKNSVDAVSVVNSFDPTGTMVNANVKVVDYSNWLMDSMGFPAQFLNTPEEATQNLQNTATNTAQANQDALDANADRQMAIDKNKAEVNSYGA